MISKKEHLIIGILIFVIMIVLASCQSKPANIDAPISQEVVAEIEAVKLLEDKEGQAMLETHCYTCHSPKSIDHDKMLAPPLAGIKYKYKNLYPERSTFISRMSDFVYHPSKENAVMKGPVRRFGLMPATPLPKEKIVKLSAFIFDHQLPVPDWFPDHFEEEHGSPWKG